MEVNATLIIKYTCYKSNNAKFYFKISFYYKIQIISLLKIYHNSVTLYTCLKNSVFSMQI